MTEKTFFYPVRADNQAFKDAAVEAGAEVSFDREKGTYRLKSEEISPEARETIETKLAAYRTPEAEAAWAADREVGLAERAAMKESAATKGDASKGDAPKAPAFDGIVVYPAKSQRAEFDALVDSTGAEKRYFSAKQAEKEGLGAHYKVATTQPEAFAGYQGAEAEARWKSEYEASVAGKGQDTPAAEAARGEAGKRAAIFFDRHKEKGFELPIGQAKNSTQQKDFLLGAMRDASDKQVKAMFTISLNNIKPLREKETQIRADHVGMPVEQFKELPFADQKAMAKTEDGKSVGLTGDDFMRQQRLQAGINALSAEMEARGIARPTQEKAAETEKGVETAAPSVEANAKGQEAPAPEQKADRSVDADAELAAAQAAMAQRRGQGR